MPPVSKPGLNRGGHLLWVGRWPTAQISALAIFSNAAVTYGVMDFKALIRSRIAATSRPLALRGEVHATRLKSMLVHTREVKAR